jgi:hypothetical protein
MDRNISVNSVDDLAVDGGGGALFDLGQLKLNVERG